MEAKHTPGPWKINGSLITSQAAMALTVASAYPPKVGNAPRDMDERDANARLIAAAPDMRAALGRVVLVLGERSILHKDDEVWAMYSEVVAAIAKAEGR